MAKRKRKVKGGNPFNYVAVPKIDVSDETKKAILAVCIVLLGVLSLLSLFGQAGSLGGVLSKGQELSFGWGRWFFPILLVAWGLFIYKEDKSYIRGAHVLGLFLFLISILSFFHFFLPRAEWIEAARGGYGGGFLGMYLARAFKNILGFWGGLVSISALSLISLLLIFNTSWASFWGEDSVFAKILYPFRALFGKLASDDEDENEAEDYEEDEPAEEVAPEEYLEFTKQQVIDTAGDPEFMKEDSADNEVLLKKQEIKENDSNISKIKIELPLSLLKTSSGKPTSGDVKSNAILIQRTLEHFGIPVVMADTSVGPTVTQYSFKPSEGVKLSKITTLSNDMALALAAHPIRIEAPIPGKSLVGVEVPNKSTAVVSLKEVIESKEFKNSKSKLTVALGKDVAGKVWSYDIDKMPHLLVAGATGSGKSVCLNAIVISLLYRNNPEDLRFIMVDPKRVELTVYDGIPHLLTPVITNVGKTVNALRWCLNEMDRRFETLAKFKKRNISSYNQNLSKGAEKMPYIVVIIDELADLMVTAAKDVESGIIRLTQMARAVGIHLVLATQRPSVDVITGLIKANTPARIAFSVASGIDSKTILDTSGAEKLLGKGDMLFLTAEISKPKRLQGALVDDDEIRDIVNYIKERSGEFEYTEGVTDRQKVGGIAGVGLEGNPNNEVDELFDEAKEIVVSSGKASASLLQRRLSIGYARAARVMDELEENGIIGPSNGAKPREILVTAGQMMAHEKMGTSGVSLHNRQEAKVPTDYLGSEEENSLGEVGDAVFKTSTDEGKDSDDDENSQEDDEESSDGAEISEDEEIDIDEADDKELDNNQKLKNQNSDNITNDEQVDDSVSAVEDKSGQDDSSDKFDEDEGMFFSK